jgi:hypothetical protein
MPARALTRNVQAIPAALALQSGDVGNELKILAAPPLTAMPIERASRAIAPGNSFSATVVTAQEHYRYGKCDRALHGASPH